MTRVLASFKRKNQVPPGGRWFYTVPETGVYFESLDSFSDLLGAVERHYGANNLPVPANLRELVEDYICWNSPKGFCNDADGAKVRLDIFAVESFTRTLFNRIRMHDDSRYYVPLAEAERRAKICMVCPCNVRQLCTSCTGLKSMAAKMVANRTTKYDGWLGACRVCGCVLSAKVHVSKEALVTHEKRLEELPENCWVKHDPN